METEQLIFALINDKKLNLVFHRKTRQYLHKNRVRKKHHQVNRCPSCGASINQEIVFDDEMAVCQYCGHQI